MSDQNIIDLLAEVDRLNGRGNLNAAISKLTQALREVTARFDSAPASDLDDGIPDATETFERIVGNITGTPGVTGQTIVGTAAVNNLNYSISMTPPATTAAASYGDTTVEVTLNADLDQPEQADEGETDEQKVLPFEAQKRPRATKPKPKS